MYCIKYTFIPGLARLQDLMNIHALNTDYLKLRNLADYAEDYRVLWKEADETFHEHHIILDCEPKSLRELLKISVDFKLQGPFRVNRAVDRQKSIKNSNYLKISALVPHSPGYA